MTDLADEFALANPDERFELLIDIFVDGLARNVAQAGRCNRRVAVPRNVARTARCRRCLATSSPGPMSAGRRCVPQRRPRRPVPCSRWPSTSCPRADARRIAVRAQLLDRTRPADLLGTVRRLTMLQLDPVNAIAPSADLVAWSRLGSAYRPADLDSALESRALIELLALIRPAGDLALFRADMAQWEQRGQGQPAGWRAAYRDWVRANDACRRDILARLAASGPAALPRAA